MASWRGSIRRRFTIAIFDHRSAAVARLPVLRGRDAQLDVLGERLAEVRSGAGTLTVVEGSAGIGKTRLLEEAVSIARRLGFRVGSGVSKPDETMVELSALTSALFDGGVPLLSPQALRGLYANAPQHALLEELRRLLEEAATHSPLLICIDDLQRADDATIAALSTLTIGLAGSPVAWILAFRPGHGSQRVESTVERLELDGAERLRLVSLESEAVAQTAADFFGAKPDPQLLEMAGRAQGSPQLLAELLVGLREEDLVRVAGGHSELTEMRLPRRVSESIPEGLVHASSSARQLATAAATLGPTFSFGDLARMLNVSPGALVAPVGELIDTDLLTETDGKLAFGHALTGERVRGSVPATVLRALDRQAAGMLIARGALPVEVAGQLASSAEPGDEVAIATLMSAAEAVACSDPGIAADMSRCALALIPLEHALRGRLVAQTVVSLHAAGRAQEAELFAQSSLKDPLPAEQEAEVWLSVAGMFALSPDVRAESGRRALSLQGLSAELRARHLAGLLHNLCVAGRPKDAEAIHAEASDAVHASGDTVAAFTLTLAEGGLQYAAAEFERSLETIETAARAKPASGDDARESLAQEWRCELMMVLDRVEEPLELAADSIAAASHDRQEWVQDVFEIWRGRMLVQTGHLQDAVAALADRFERDDERAFGVLDAAGLVALGTAALQIGDGGLTSHTARIAEVIARGNVPGVRRHGAWLLALQAMADGDAVAACRHLRERDEPGRNSVLPRYPIDCTDEPHLVRIALAGGDRELAAGAVESAERRVELNQGVCSISAAAAHARGLLSDSSQELARAVELYEKICRPLALASALEDLGRVYANGESQSPGIDALDRARLLYEEAGAARDARRVRARLRSHGVRRRLVASERPTDGWAAMTDSELAVARLVATGLTNREVAERLFVSPHTVSSHLRHLFVKLKINSRVELTRLAMNLDEDRPDRTAGDNAVAVAAQ
jgi:DNA-binding CsgD family transcriptional regulator